MVGSGSGVRGHGLIMIFIGPASTVPQSLGRGKARCSCECRFALWSDLGVSSKVFDRGKFSDKFSFHGSFNGLSYGSVIGSVLVDSEPAFSVRRRFVGYCNGVPNRVFNGSVFIFHRGEAMKNNGYFIAPSYVFCLFVCALCLIFNAFCFCECVVLAIGEGSGSEFRHVHFKHGFLFILSPNISVTICTRKVISGSVRMLLTSELGTNPFNVQKGVWVLNLSQGWSWWFVASASTDPVRHSLNDILMSMVIELANSALNVIRSVCSNASLFRLSSSLYLVTFVFGQDFRPVY